MLNRSTSFRPRPIDINQKLPVYVGDAETGQINSPSLDSSSAPSTPDLGGGRGRRRGAKPLLVDPLEIEAVMEECMTSTEETPIKPQEVATPSFRTLDDPEYIDEPPSPWKRPTKYIHYEEKPPAVREKLTEYDLDSDDESFRSDLNVKLKNKSVVNENTFEKLIDTFEKEFFRQFKGKGLMTSVWDSEEDFKCSVCNRAATEPNNPIIYCDTCDMTTHVECYGLQNTPRGSWFCTKCKSKDQLEVSCVLCTERGGAFKRTKDGEWAHLSCAMWLMEKDDVLSPTNLKSTFVIDTSLVPREKRDLLCCICNRSHGGCVKCSQPECQATYHVTCAMRMGFFAEIKNPKRGASFKSFCKKHSALYCERKKESQKTKRRMEEEKLMGEDFSQLVPVATLNARNLGRLKKEVIQDVYAYWKKKRLAAGKPLIGRLQIEEDEIRHSASYKQEREYTEMRKIRQGMEIARLLLDLVGKRERLKQRQLNIMQELFEEQLLLGNEALESPKVKAKAKVSADAKKAEKVLASPRKAETLRRKSTGTSGKSTMQQEIEEAIKKTSTTSRRKSTTALSSAGSKRNTSEPEHDPLLPEASLVRPSDNGTTKTRPRATKKRRQSELVIDVVGVADNMEEAVSSTGHRSSLKRERTERLIADAERFLATRQNSPSGVKIKRLAKRKRRSNSASDTQTQENEADSTSTGKFVHTKAVEKEAASEETRDDELSKSEDDGDQDYTKGKRKRKRRSINEVTDQRITRAQSKRASFTPELSPPPEEDVLPEALPITGKAHATPAVRTPSGKVGNQRKSTTKSTAATAIDLSDEDDGGNNVSDEEDYSPLSRSSPDSSPDRRSKDADGPIVLKKNRQTKINGFFPVLKKAEKKATHARKQGFKSGEDSADGEEDAETDNIEEVEDEEAEDKKEQDSATTRKKRKARRTSGGTRRSPAQKMATAAAAAAAVAARRPLQAKKSR